MMIITFVLVILAIAIIAGICYLVIRADELDAREEGLYKYSVQLDERANRIAADENTLRSISQSFKKEIEEFRNKDIYTVSYIETDSDTMRYTTDALAKSNAKKQLAKTIARDIVKDFSMNEDLTDDGRKRFTYRFKIVEQ